MSMKAPEAREALAEIERTRERAKIFHGYHYAAPYCVLWGVIMFLANGANQVLPPQQQGVVWLISGLGGMLVSVVMRLRFKNKATFEWRKMATIAAVLAFVLSAMLVMKPESQIQVNAFISLLLALLYVVGGIWLGVRYLITGLVVAVMVLYAYFNMREYYSLFMALAYGGALIATGLWLKKG